MDGWGPIGGTAACRKSCCTRQRQQACTSEALLHASRPSPAKPALSPLLSVTTNPSKPICSRSTPAKSCSLAQLGVPLSALKAHMTLAASAAHAWKGGRNVSRTSRGSAFLPPHREMGRAHLFQGEGAGDTCRAPPLPCLLPPADQSARPNPVQQPSPAPPQQRAPIVRGVALPSLQIVS